MLKTTLIAAVFPATTTTHTAAWAAEGMHCPLGNTTTSTNLNNNLPVDPFYNLVKAKWWTVAATWLSPPRIRSSESPLGVPSPSRWLIIGPN